MRLFFIFFTAVILLVMLVSCGNSQPDSFDVTLPAPITTTAETTPESTTPEVTSPAETTLTETTSEETIPDETTPTVTEPDFSNEPEDGGTKRY